MDAGDRGPSGAAPEEAHRHLLELLRGIRDLDAALGAWRPDYGGLPARGAPDPEPPADLTGAHHRYAAGLRYFAANPAVLEGLGDAARGDVEAAMADARDRCGAPAIPFEDLMRGRPGQAVGGAPPWEGPERGGRGEPPVPAAPGEPGEGRRPRSGVALWIGVAALLVAALIVTVVLVAAHVFLGTGPTAAPGVPTAAPATLPPGAVSTGSLPDVLAPAQACAAIPSGQLAPGLAIAATSTGIGTDPATGYSTPYIAVTLASPVGAQTPAFTLVTVVLPSGASPPSSGPPIDRAGIVQLIARWDGAHWFAALRSWSGSSWSAPADSGVQGVDVTQSGATLTIYWQGLNDSDQLGEIVAASGGCATHDLDAGLTPTTRYAG